jgi:uncharacterized membrane protein
MEGRTNRRPLIAAGVLLGVGLGGFVDGWLGWDMILPYPPSSLQLVFVNDRS